MAMQEEPTGVTLRMKGTIARFVGIVAIALGFIIGIYGLEDTGAPWLHIALGLLTTGMLAQAYALYCSVMHKQKMKGQSKL
jgi:hypothetical protein